MKFIADLHIHSRFSRATSRDLDPEHLCLWARKKGIGVIGTGDFTHPAWIKELRDKLIEAEDGLYRLRPELEASVERDVPPSCINPPRFILSCEISCIYKRGGRTRKVHHLILMPDLAAAERFNRALERIGNIRSDGRPILGLDSRDLLETALEASAGMFFIPAHIWTPWFSLFGSKSGFDEMEECFGELTPHIHALETGLSSDPPMNRLLSALDRYVLVSNSDAHSPSKLGREANIFDTGLDYDSMINAMKGREGFEGTIEFFPEEGKYHMDGHRKCGVMFAPSETMARQGICPSCGKPITVGVLNRVEELADRHDPRITRPFYSMIPLNEILAEIHGCGPATKKVISLYDELISALGPELDILMNADLTEIRDRGGMLLSMAIDRMRRGEVIRQEGYDGEYGVIRLFNETEKAELAGQASLFGGTVRSRPQKRSNRSEKTGRTGKPKGNDRTDKVESLDDPVIGTLNREQRDAVLYNGGHLLITAGPGTGKTMTLTHRVAGVVRAGIAGPDQVLALTFTNKAAREMKERIGGLLPDMGGDRVKVSTFHGLCLDLLREYGEKTGIPKGFTICSEEDSRTLALGVASESGRGRQFADRLLRHLPGIKAASAMGTGLPEGCDDIIPLAERYRERLRGLGMLDLDDLETEAIRLFRGHPDTAAAYSARYTRIFVDEYQDTSPLQEALLRMLVKEGINEICAIGDPDQAIYGFRGADVQSFHGFAEAFPGAMGVTLARNYRSTQVILDGASRLMGRDGGLEGSNGRGDPISLAVCATPAEEAEMVVEQIERLLGGTGYFSLDSGRVSSHEDGEGIGFGDIAVLYRLNAQGDAFEEALTRAGIPFARSGERPITGQYPADIICRFLRAATFPDNILFRDAYLALLEEREIKVRDGLGRFVNAGDIGGLIDQAITIHGLDVSSRDAAGVVARLRDIAEGMADTGAFLNALSLDRGIDHACLAGDRVALMSLHASKGLEWPVVFISGCEAMLIPCGLFGERDPDEEKRLFYVGMTRARNRLILSRALKRNLNGRVLEAGPSPFLSLIPEDLREPLQRNRWRRRRKKQEQLTLFQG